MRPLQRKKHHHNEKYVWFWNTNKITSSRLQNILRQYNSLIS